MLDFSLINQDAKQIRLSQYRGRVLLLTFIYTRCPMPDFCPLMERHFADVQARVKEDARLRDRVHLVAITFDPEHDTPEVLRAHARARGADPRMWTYLTGTPAAIEQVASRFGVSVMRDGDEAATITHNLRTAIVDGRGRVVRIYSGTEWTPAMLVDGLRDASGRR
jgi:protein SCO1/2